MSLVAIHREHGFCLVEDVTRRIVVEREDLSMRMHMRLIRRTNGFSEKLENSATAVALYRVPYFGRVHRTFGVPQRWKPA